MLDNNVLQSFIIDMQNKYVTQYVMPKIWYNENNSDAFFIYGGIIIFCWTTCWYNRSDEIDLLANHRIETRMHHNSIRDINLDMERQMTLMRPKDKCQSQQFF